MPTDREQLLELEAARCDALGNRDVEALRAVVDPNVVHIHATGRVQHGDEYFNYATAAAYRRTDRGDLDVLIEGDVAIMLGPIVTTVRQQESDEPRSIEGVALQVWRNRPQTGWLQVSFQFTPTPHES
jgi:ketosteroid isomerase-like protein